MATNSQHGGWAKTADEEDRVEKLIKESGCWDNHLKVVDKNFKSLKLVLRKAAKFLIPRPNSLKRQNKMEFLNLFEDGDIDQAADASQPFISKFEPSIHHNYWFFSKDYSYFSSVEELYQAFAFFDRGSFEKAFEIFSILFASTKQNRFSSNNDDRFYSQMFIKFSIGQVLRKNLPRVPQIIRILHSEVLSKFSSHEDEYIFTICLLCSLADLPEHWLLFVQKPGMTKTKNLKLGSLVRALLSYAYNYQHSLGFVKTGLQKRISQLEKLLRNQYTKDEIEMARQKMTTKYEHVAENNAAVHDSRRKNDFLNLDEQKVAVEVFRRKYSWMFDDF
ncbi:unnamed protein product [Caenorhabditis auriculariae]|uniref:Uncharacterized protein n=1 Tax=Caenorhabditis auriculariae TaxID=2777116 RepID=A0A8S1GV15_9PELO|nr:unnamed protein product [Caenorhabditis auriculariae]